MGQHANFAWNLPEGKPDGKGVRTYPDAVVHSALLMDIRRELQQLNRILGCANFLRLPHTVEKIRQNTAKPRAKKVKE